MADLISRGRYGEIYTLKTRKGKRLPERYRNGKLVKARTLADETYRYYMVPSVGEHLRASRLDISIIPDPEANNKEFRTNKPLVIQKAAFAIAKAILHEPHKQNHKVLTYRNTDHMVARHCHTERLIKDTFRAVIAKVLGTMILNYSLEYKMIGKPDKKGKFWHLPIKDIASQAGVSKDQAVRVIQWVKRRGAYASGQVYDEKIKQEEGKYVGLPGPKHLTHLLFRIFSLEHWFVKERAKAQARTIIKKRDAKPTNRKQKSKEAARQAMMNREGMQNLKEKGLDVSDLFSVKKPRTT